MVPIRNLLLTSEAQVRALTVKLMCCGASELLGWVSYLPGPRENEAQRLGWSRNCRRG